MGVVQFFKDRHRIHQAGKAGKIETEIKRYNDKPDKTDEDWKHLAKLNAQQAKIVESNKIKSERNTTTKYSNTSVGFNFKGSQQVGANQDNKQLNKTNSKSRKKK